MSEILPETEIVAVVSRAWERWRIADAAYQGSRLVSLARLRQISLNTIIASSTASIDERCRIGKLVVRGEMGEKNEKIPSNTIVRHHSVIKQQRRSQCG